jgi:hypothetical protein
MPHYRERYYGGGCLGCVMPVLLFLGFVVFALISISIF